jgi:hypothetical protein
MITKEQVEQIFELGAKAHYEALNLITYKVDKEQYAKFKEDAVKLFCQPVVMCSVCKQCDGRGSTIIYNKCFMCESCDGSGLQTCT